MCAQIGCHVDDGGNPGLVSHKAWAFRTPEPRYPGERFPYRTSWVWANGSWERIENAVKWIDLEDQHQFIPQGPMAGLITIFQSRTRRDQCLDDVPFGVKRRKKEQPPEQINVTQGNTQSKTKLKRMLEKEIPHASIPERSSSLSSRGG